MSVSPVLLMMKVLRASAALTAIAGDRVYAQIAPQQSAQPGTAPAAPHVVVRLVGQSEGGALDGPSGLMEGRVVVMGLAADYATAEGLASAIMDLSRGPSLQEVDGRRVTLFAEGANTSDFLPDLKLFRRAIEVRIIVPD